MNQTPEETRKYELMVIISGEMLESDFEKETEELRKLLHENSKGIAYEEVWGKREFATRVKKQRNGYYVFFVFNAEPQAILEIRNAIKLNQIVLKHLLITLPSDYDPTTYNRDIFIETRKPSNRPGADKKAKVAEVAVEEPKAEEAPMEPKKPEVEKAKVAGKKEEKELATVEKRLEKILENPDIDIK